MGLRCYHFQDVIQDEKILGTVHIATGHDDHLGGNITPDLFKQHKNTSHDDVLYAPHKTPEIRLPEVRMFKNGKTEILIQKYKPSEFMVSVLEAEIPCFSLVDTVHAYYV